MANEIKIEDLSGSTSSENTTSGASKPPKTHLQYGLIAGLTLIALFVVYYVMGWTFKQSLIRWLPPIVFMFIIITAQFTHAKAVNGDIKYGNLFAVGFKTAAVATCIYLVFMFLFILLAPSYKESMLEASRQGMIKRGLSTEQVEAGMVMVKKFFMVSTFAGLIIGELVIGLIASLIGAAIAPKNPKPEFQSLQ